MIYLLKYTFAIYSCYMHLIEVQQPKENILQCEDPLPMHATDTCLHLQWLLAKPLISSTVNDLSLLSKHALLIINVIC